MDFMSLAAFLALTAGTPAQAKTDATCCNATKAKAPAKVRTDNASRGPESLSSDTASPR